MKQATTELMPASAGAATVMVVWPSIARYPLGCRLGELCRIQAGWYIFTVGNLLALASIPCALALYVYRVLRGSAYKLTNRGLVELRHAGRSREKLPFFEVTYGEVFKSLALDQFETIDVVRRPGQDWFDAGDLVFRRGAVETFRLEGVAHPEAFRNTCLKSRLAYVAVRRVLDRPPALP